SAESASSSISFESATASVSSDPGEALYASTVDTVPLFLNFSCTLRFSNREVYTFPIDHLPSCVMELLKHCSEIYSKSFTGMDLIRISFGIYVLSWPVVRATSVGQLDAYMVSPKKPDFSPKFRKFANYFDFDYSYPAATLDVISQLPRSENEAVLRLESGISRLLKMETVLVLSRYDVTLDTLQRVMNFTIEEVDASFTDLKFLSTEALPYHQDFTNFVAMTRTYYWSEASLCQIFPLMLVRHIQTPNACISRSPFPVVCVQFVPVINIV
ncbi:unnamed protein product, partial [Gongylonema pulchrum]|uniref:FH2 domain-containing protein n=1 Tax=Gongylonema pulchrum TaxID=637853 RepID=A0A183D8A8_9BILA